MNIGRHLRIKREALGLKQRELAREVNVSPQHISQIERSDANPSLDLVIALSRTLGVTTDYLLTGHDTAPVDIRGAIRSQPLTPVAKRSLLQLIAELNGAG